MELRWVLYCTVVLAVVCFAQNTEARHSMHRRQTDDYDVLADAAIDDEAQNDGDGGNDADEEPEVSAVILTQSTHYNITLGDNVRLECKVSPADGTVVQWTKNGTMYFFGTMKTQDQHATSYAQNQRISIPANSTDLLIKNVTIADSDTYKCEVLQTNRVTIEHTLNIQEKPKIVKFSASNNGEVVEGSNLMLTCVVGGSPPPQIIWSRDTGNGNERLQEKDGEFSINSLHIKNVKTSDAGKYYCYAFNGVGNKQAEITVVVKSKPRVHVPKAIINSAVNVEAVLQCSVHEAAPAHIRWYKDGSLIEDTSSQFTVSTRDHHSNLTVTPTSDQDFGTFTCEADNDLGKHNRSIELVQEPVVEDLDVDGPKLTWTIHSHQPLEQIELQLRQMSAEGQWKTINVPLPDIKTHEYEIIYPLSEQDLEPGKYEATVKVKNEKSWSQHTPPAFVDIVYRGNSGHTIRPTLLSAISTTLMYLLVRML
ncbi:PREDICTED: protein amalgam-like isoform X2 [Papilio xuthus]|uniref:Hemolin n=1 Tax=Papilio xuthus TaxID=66420 RepID=A0AAJ6ZSY9_PAPXU|nr:PREDICTED: protein amalgam-like isoform X2 [Papilio xuthus]